MESRVTTARPPSEASNRLMPSRPFIAAVLLLCIVPCTSFTRAQQPTATSSVADVERVRDGLSRNPSIFAVEIAPDYRVRVETDEEDMRLKMAWIYDDSITPGYVRPWYPIYHFEMQQMMLPRDFRAHLYPIGVPISNPVKLFSDAMRKRREDQARERVRAELEALRKATAETRKDPGVR